MLRMLTISLLVNAVLLASLLVTLLMVRKYRRRLYANEHRLRGPIPTVPLNEFDPLFRHTEHGPTPDAEVAYIGSGDGVRSGTSDAEAWVLAVLSKRALRMFEFGTCTGKTAYLWAKNSPPEARVATLTLAPEQHEQYQAEARDRSAAGRRALKASLFTRFLYTGTDVEGKVEQIFEDSKHFDETPYLASFDLIFIDGSHAYSYVKSDSEKALRMLAPGGTILWHDYNALSSNTRGVYDYLNEIRDALSLVHLRGTSLVAHRSPPAAT